MRAMYFMGVSSGKSKKGNDFYTVQILWQNGFGNLEVKPLFVDHETYEMVKDMDMKRGTAVSLSVNLGGGLEAITESDKFAPIVFDVPLAKPNKDSKG